MREGVVDLREPDPDPRYKSASERWLRRDRGDRLELQQMLEPIRFGIFVSVS